MMKAISFILCLLFFFNVSFCQDTIHKVVEKKLKIEIIAGGYYKYFFGKRYIEPTPTNPGDDFALHQYERFTKIPTQGFQGGFLLSLKVYRNLFLKSGLLFCNRKIIFENNQDTVIKYGNGSSMRDIHNVIKYNYSYNNIEIPILLSYTIRRINLSTGVRIPIWTFYKAKYTYVINQFPQNPQWTTSEKTIENSKFYFMIIPTIQASYDLKIKNYTFEPYLGVDFSSQKSFYLKGGIILPLKNFFHESKT